MELNKTHLGDCLSVIPEIIEAKSIDLILCDLPYGKTNCAWDTPIDLSKLWFQYERIIKDNGAILLFGQTPFDKVLGASNLQLLKYEWIWEKPKATGHLNAKKMPMKAHENILVFYKSLPTYNPQKTFGHAPVHPYIKSIKDGTADGEIYGKTVSVSGGGSTERYPRSVQTFSSDTQKVKLHPTQKPLKLIEYLISTYTNEGDLVLDNCCGSGTTGLASKNLNRNYIMIDNDKKYYNITKERLNEK
jgi:DNA modification methylase